VGLARIEGGGGIVKKRGGEMKAFVEGALSWNGRPWLSGRIALGTGGASITGRVQFAVDLTPSQLPGGIKVAGLFFQVDLEAGFELDTQAGFARASLKGSWALGVRLAADSQQLLPLAMQSIDLALEAALLEAELLHVQGFKLLPFDTGLPDSVQIPIPVIKPKTGGKKVRFGQVKYNNPSPVPDETRNAMRFEGVTIELVAGALPWVTGNALTEETGSLPLETVMEWKRLDLPLDSNFTLSLAWHNGQLKLKVSRPSRTPKYFGI
jgi:hypothetical protein